MSTPLPRRNFLKYTGAAAAAAGFPAHLLRAEATADGSAQQATDTADVLQEGEAAVPARHEQLFNVDYQSNRDGCEYYFLGNGLITAALQTTRSPGSGTHCGILLMSSEHFARKASTFLFHPERGLQNSRLQVEVNGVAYVPLPESSTVAWTYPDAIPTVAVDWHAGACIVHEEFFCPIGEPALIRTVSIRNTSNAAASVCASLALYPNLMLFDEYSVDRAGMTLVARGFAEMQMFSPETTRIGDRHLLFDIGMLAPAALATVSAVLTVDRARGEFQKRSVDELRAESSAYWKSGAQLRTNNASYDHLFHTSHSSLRAAVARSGKTDGGIWQYNLEWVRDQSMIAAGCSMIGRLDLAEALLRRMMTRSVDEHGGTVDSSRTRPPETMELDQNGELLYSLWVHWVWSGSDTLLREHWKKIRLLAEYVLQPVFRDPAIGLLKNTREYWERDEHFGVKDGYELTYQMWNIIGLGKASEIAAFMNEPGLAKRWHDASALMNRSFLSHPKYSLVHENRVIKRRAADGTPQRTFEPRDRKSMPPGSPLNVETVSLCDPDAGDVLPIVFGLVDPKGDLARNTLQSMEELWNQRWTIGGYGRYHATSEPDGPGPWPFATMFIARASLEAGNDEQVIRALQWMGSVNGGASGAWLEVYCDRPVPPLPPVGIVVWTWAEIVMFFMHHVLGVRPSSTHLVLRPRVFTGLDTVDAVVPVRGMILDVKLRRAQTAPFALVDGVKTDVHDGTLVLPFTGRNRSVEFFV